MLVALYDFRPTHSHTLGFRAEDKFLTVGGAEASHDPSWLNVVTARGGTGFVPANYVTAYQASPAEQRRFLDGCIDALRLRDDERQSNGSPSSAPHGRLMATLLRRVKSLKGVAPGAPGKPSVTPNRTPSATPHGTPSATPHGTPSATPHETLPVRTPRGKRAAPTPPQAGSVGTEAERCVKPAAPIPKAASETSLLNESFGDASTKSTSCHDESKKSEEKIFDKMCPATVAADVGASHTNGNAAVAYNAEAATTTQHSLADSSEAACSTPTESNGHIKDYPAVSHQSKDPVSTTLAPPCVPVGLRHSLASRVRAATNISYSHSEEAVDAVLRKLAESLPQLRQVLEAIAADRSSHTEGDDRVRLVAMVESLRLVKDDSQQRSWALHEDLQTIHSQLGDLLQLLTHGQVAQLQAALALEDFLPLQTFVQYYQMETRPKLRSLLLQIFSVCCRLDPANARFLVSSVLTLDIFRELISRSASLKASLSLASVLLELLPHSSSLPYSCGPHLPALTLYLIRHIELYGSQAHTHELSELYMAVLLSLNSQNCLRELVVDNLGEPEKCLFENDREMDGMDNLSLSGGESVSTKNIILHQLSEQENTTYFIEKLLLYFNREEDPLGVSQGGRLTFRMLEDVYSWHATARLAYTSDENVLCDVLLRRGVDTEPGQIRSAVVRVSCAVVRHGRWLGTAHRLSELRDLYAAVLEAAADTATAVAAAAADVAAVTQLLDSLPADCGNAALLRTARRSS